MQKQLKATVYYTENGRSSQKQLSAQSEEELFQQVFELETLSNYTRRVINVQYRGEVIHWGNKGLPTATTVLEKAEYPFSSLWK